MKTNDTKWDVPLGEKKEKPWGYERPIGVFQGVFLKELFLRKGKFSSLHYHEEKDEFFYLVSGQLKIILEDEEHELNPGDTLHISPGKHHRIIPQENSLILELGTRMFGDVIRLADEYQRSSRE